MGIFQYKIGKLHHFLPLGIGPNFGPIFRGVITLDIITYILSSVLFLSFVSFRHKMFIELKQWKLVNNWMIRNIMKILISKWYSVLNNMFNFSISPFRQFCLAIDCWKHVHCIMYLNFCKQMCDIWKFAMMTCKYYTSRG